MRYLLLQLFIFLSALFTAYYAVVDDAKDVNIHDFIKSKSQINQFNRFVILPRLKTLMSNDYFRYVRMNLQRPCKLWCNAEKCNLRDCKVKQISDPNLCPTAIYDDELSTVDTKLTNSELGLLTKFFECYDDDDEDSHYIDLLVNPERYTGYSGESAHRVWRAIYEENCFVRKLWSPFDNEVCHEKRLFYEAISGLHSSINIHLCAEYPSNGLITTFQPNLEEFLRRFDGHSDYLENLYQLYLLELKALLQIKQYLLKKVKWPDDMTKAAVSDLFNVVGKTEIPMLEGNFSFHQNHMSHDLPVHFHNITTTIMDCVACDKCKLWGKVQLRGLGAAFKILSIEDITKLYLTHQEIVSLFNAITRLSQTIRHLETFRDLYNSRLNKVTEL